MGKFEKIVVLAVLFLVTLILVVSLNTDEPKTLHASLGGVEEGTPEDPGDPASDLMKWRAEDADGLESTAFDPSTALLSGRFDGRAQSGHAVMLPQGSILCDAAGLVETPDPQRFRHYVVVGETYESLALRYYGDVSLIGMLQRANDDLREAPSAESVILPAFNPDVNHSGRLSGTTYRVLEGDNLSKISLKFYGDAKEASWDQILQANLHQISSPRDLRPGMVLRIP